MAQLDPYARQRMSTAASVAYVAMSWISMPENWPAFSAWAEQQIPDETWTERDRMLVAADAQIMRKLAEVCDE